MQKQPEFIVRGSDGFIYGRVSSRKNAIDIIEMHERSRKNGKMAKDPKDRETFKTTAAKLKFEIIET